VIRKYTEIAYLNDYLVKVKVPLIYALMSSQYRKLQSQSKI